MSAQVFWLAWAQISGVGAVLMQRMEAEFGSLAAAWQADRTALQQVAGIGAVIAESIDQQRRQIEPRSFWERHLQSNPEFWTLADADYPSWLREIADPPPVLYYRGKVDLLENQGVTPAIAIVGTRHPSTYGRRWTCRIASHLTQAGMTIVSGLAEGIDTEAHQSCLAAEGRTIAVLGTGVDQVYPASNRLLSRQIVRQGLLLSEYPAGTKPDRSHFPRRNRVIAGLSRATLVMEAPKKSGSLITARLANDYGREVYALPGSLDNPRSQGCLQLLDQGAQMILGETELLERLESLLHLSSGTLAANGQLALDMPIAEPAAPDIPKEPLEPDLEQVFQAVPLEPIAVDSIVQQSALATGTVLSALAQLEMMGLVSQLPGMRYQRG